jgi:hypothetical protein
LWGRVFEWKEESKEGRKKRKRLEKGRYELNNE